MSSDRQQFNQALRYWHELHRQQAYSVPPRYGKLAIIASFSWGPTEFAEGGGRTFEQEAYDLARGCKKARKRVEIFKDADGDDIRQVLSDPEYSDVITIGHGALGYLYIGNGTRQVATEVGAHGIEYIKDDNDRFDWRDVAQSATHLKLGRFVQRQCGNFSRNLSVPMGLFAVSSHFNVYAAVGENFQPLDIYEDSNNAIRPVCNVQELGRQAIKRLFDHEEFLISRTPDSSDT